MSDEKTINERLAEWDDEDMRSALKVKWGRRLIWRLMGKCGIFMQSFIPGDQDLTSFNEGRRSIGLTLLKQVIDINPESYVLMEKESKKEAKYVRGADERESEQRQSDLE